MMRPVFSVRDQMVGFNDPFIAVNQQVAERDFTNVVNNPNGRIYLNPNHYDLYRIGDFDTEKGILIPSEPELILTGMSVKKGNENEI